MIELETSGSAKIAIASDFHLGGKPTGMDPVPVGRFEKELLALPEEGIEIVLFAGDVFHHEDLAQTTLHDVETILTDFKAQIIWVNGNHEEVSKQAREISEMVSSLPNCEVLDNHGIIVTANGIRTGIVGAVGVAGGFGKSMFWSSPDRDYLYDVELQRTRDGITHALQTFEEDNVELLLAATHYPLLVSEGYEIAPSLPSEVGLLIAHANIPAKEIVWGHFHTDILPHSLGGIPSTNVSASVNLINEGGLFRIRVPQRTHEGIVFLAPPFSHVPLDDYRLNS